MRQRVTAVFVAVVAAFVALDFVVLFSLWPQVHRTETLSTQRAEASRLIALMHEDLHAMSLAAAVQYAHLHAGEEGEELVAARRDFDVAAAHLDLVSRQYAATRLDPAQARQWQRFSAQVVPAFLETARRVGRATPASAGGDDLAELRLRREDADLLLQQIAEANANVLVAETKALHESVHTLAIVCVVLGAIGIVSGLLLVRWALLAVREFERGMQDRLDELDTFAGRIAHDLRNPLQTIGMSLAIIRQRVADERTLATCGRAQDSVKRASQFIQELLAFARSGARPAKGVSADVEQVLRDVQNDLAAQAERSNIQLLVRPSAAVHAGISSEALHAIVANLADNAVKYMPADRGERVVEMFTTTARRGEVEIHVVDNGGGIPAEALPRVFDGFYRASDVTGGFGIGLATVKRLVDAHGGRTIVKSEVGRGSHFTVVLPAAPPPASDAEPATEASPES